MTDTSQDQVIAIASEACLADVVRVIEDEREQWWLLKDDLIEAERDYGRDRSAEIAHYGGGVKALDAVLARLKG